VSVSNSRSNISEPGKRPSSPLSVKGVSKAYGSGSNKLHALIDIDLTLRSGTFTAVMGPSGSGKTTLLNCILGLDKPDQGSIFVGDTDVTRLNETRLAEMRRSRLGIVFQSYNLIPALTAADNISLPMRLAEQPIDWPAVHNLAEAVGVGNFLDHRPHQLSGGQQQRVAFARALIMNPEIVVADEPTGALDSASAEAVLALLRSIVHDFGQQVLMVTHDPVAASAADRVLFMADGRWQGETAGGDAGRIAAALAGLRQAR
jgi:putative ABC transport system ATP-binding protein